jgi:four helix bundle protein
MECEIYSGDRLMEGERVRSFEELRCWQLCREFKFFVIREVLPKLPKEERFRLADQIIRAARSTTANIAEGYGRFHYADNAKFVSNARGSCHEVLDHLISACDEILITESILTRARMHYDPAIRSLNGYLSYLQRASKSSNPSRNPQLVTNNP